MTYDELVKDLRYCASTECTCGECKHNNEMCCETMLLEQAADVIDKLSKQVDDSIPKSDAEIIIAEVAKPSWIPVTERLPEKRKYVLVRYKNNDMAVACWFDGDEDVLFWRAMTDEGWCADCDTDPTHWMPLPSTEGLNET